MNTWYMEPQMRCGATYHTAVLIWTLPESLKFSAVSKVNVGSLLWRSLALNQLIHSYVSSFISFIWSLYVKYNPCKGTYFLSISIMKEQMNDQCTCKKEKLSTPMKTTGHLQNASFLGKLFLLRYVNKGEIHIVFKKWLNNYNGLNKCISVGVWECIKNSWAFPISEVTFLSDEICWTRRN